MQGISPFGLCGKSSKPAQPENLSHYFADYRGCQEDIRQFGLTRLPTFGHFVKFVISCHYRQLDFLLFRYFLIDYSFTYREL
jgi:hypothetical protein